MIPQWMNETENYKPVKDSSRFISSTIRAISQTMAKLRVQQGHEKTRTIPAVVKLLLLVFLIILMSASHNLLVLLTLAAGVQAYLCTWPARDIWSIFRTSLFAGLLAFILFAPAMIMNPVGIGNNIMVVIKVFVSVEMVSIFNHTTQWNHVTGALRKLHVPGIFIFVLDITLKYIVLLGTLINELLLSLTLRSVGKNNKKYQSLGGIMGVTFIRSTEMSREMYEAMQCRGFTDDYKGL